MSEYYLIVRDDEIEYASSQISTLLSLTEQAILQYRQILTKLSGDAVVSGKVHDALVVYDEYIQILENSVKQLSDSMTRLTNRYIADLEATDDYLYDAGILDTVRDFSQSQYETLKKCLDDPWCDFTDSIGDWFYGIADTVVNFLNWKSAKKYLNNCHASLLDYNNETLQGLTLMFDEVHAIDAKYGNQSDADSAGSLLYILDTAKYLAEVMALMAEIISPKSNIQFTTENIRAHVGGKFDELMKKLEKTVAVAESDKAPAIAQISDFCSQPWAWTYFSGFMQAYMMFMADLNDWDTAGMVVFNMFDVSENVMYHIGDGLDYSQRRIKEELLEMLEELGETEDPYKGSEYEETIKDCKVFLKYLKKFGKDKLYKWMNEHRQANGKLILDGRTIEARKFRALFKTLGDTINILSKGEDAIELVARFVTDYTRATEFLDSFANNCSDPDMLRAAQDIRALFDKEFGAWTCEVVYKLEEYGWEGVTDLLAEGNSVMVVVKGIELGLDLGGSITGVGSHAKNQLNAMAYISIHSASSSAYDAAIAKVKEADPNSEEYEALCKDAYNCFEITRKNMVKMFKTMEAATSGDKSAYYRYCARQAENLSMSDMKEPDILTYEEFLAVGKNSSGSTSSSGGGRSS